VVPRSNYSGYLITRKKTYTAGILLLVELTGHEPVIHVSGGVNEYDDILFADDNLQNRTELEIK
jgi:hypothetical protein